MKKYLETGQELIIEHQNESIAFCRVITIDERENEYCGQIIKVNLTELFDNPPIEKVNKDVQELNMKLKEICDEISEKKKELFSLKQEVAKTTKTQIDNQKFIINRSELLNANSLVLFPQRRIEPFIIKNEDHYNRLRELKIQLFISLSSGEERSWGYKIYHESSDYSEYLDEKYGYLINPTDEDIKSHSIMRQSVIKFDDDVIKRTPDNLLSEENLLRKSEILKEIKENEKKKLEDELEKTKKRLSEIIN